LGLLDGIQDPFDRLSAGAKEAYEKAKQEITQNSSQTLTDQDLVVEILSRIPQKYVSEIYQAWQQSIRDISDTFEKL